MSQRALATAVVLGLLAVSALAQRAPLNTDMGNAPGVVNVNAAAEDSLVLLYRTSKKMAAQIIAERAKAPFTDSNDLRERIKGCSPTWFSVNTPHLAFAGETTLKHRVRRPVTNSLPSFPSAPGLP
jgi:DNA uptake protein ComE-like DNA-binding protein